MKLHAGSALHSRRLIFNLALCLTVLFGLFLVFRLGFRAMAIRADVAPERLRDFTFPVWSSVPWLKHGFLTFLSADAYAKHEAYANHSTVYLLFMRGLLKLQQWMPVLGMRMSGAILAMVASLGAIWVVVRSHLAHGTDWRRALLLLAAVLYFLTSPGFWISLGKFNVDNAFVFVFPALLLSSALLHRDHAGGRPFWISAVVMSLFMPMASALFGLFMLGMALVGYRADKRWIVAALALMALSVILYLQPVLVAKALGFSSENSTWLFRSGLDGDMRFYGNFIDSVIAPQFNRPWYLLAVPAALLASQWAYCRWQSAAADESSEQPGSVRSMAPVFSVYMLMLLFWPQAVSIHPYLYDALLMGPLMAWIVINFATREVFARHSLAWLFVLAFLIHFNLTKIAQAAQCVDCYFPAWGMLGGRAG